MLSIEVNFYQNLSENFNVLKSIFEQTLPNRVLILIAQFQIKLSEIILSRIVLTEHAERNVQYELFAED